MLLGENSHPWRFLPILPSSGKDMAAMRFTCHIHRCTICAEEWTCSNRDCPSDDMCGRCDRERFEEYMASHGWFEPEVKDVDAF